MWNIIKKVLLVILMLLILFIVFNWKDVKAFPSIIGNYYAKEYCSCVYVTQQSGKFCHNYVRQYIPLSSFEHDVSTKTIIATGFLFFNGKAQFIDDNQGCRFIKD